MCSGLGNKRKKPAVASAANAIAEFGDKFVLSIEKMVNANKSIQAEIALRASEEAEKERQHQLQIAKTCKQQ
ncbi:MAG: hypothetical protein SGPRY_004255 [Prymnesium sp.]